jgi:predicted nucleic acid-binding protein
MSVDAAIDSNVLLYAVSRLAEDKSKRERAEALIGMPFGVSAQILQEFYVNATRKIKTPLAPDEARAWVELLALQPCVPVDVELVRRGIDLSRRYQISYWDGTILAAAETLGAETLYTEDLNDGQLYGSVRAVNPFRSA